MRIVRVTLALSLCACFEREPQPACDARDVEVCGPTACVCAPACTVDVGCEAPLVCIEDVAASGAGGCLDESAFVELGYVPASCFEDRFTAGLLELGRASLDRDPCQAVTPSEDALCQLNMAATDVLPRVELPYRATIEELRERAQIAANVPLDATPDLVLSTGGIAGGRTDHDHVVVDGKLMDIFDELARYLTMRETGRTNLDFVTAVDELVAAHAEVPGGRATARVFPPDVLLPEEEERAREMYLSLAATFLFHEFGHYWALGCVDLLRAQALGIANERALEIDADTIAGALVAKAEVDPTIAVLAFTVMNADAAQRNGQISSAHEVRGDFGADRAYPLFEREAFFFEGYNGYRSVVQARDDVAAPPRHVVYRGPLAGSYVNEDDLFECNYAVTIDDGFLTYEPAGDGAFGVLRFDLTETYLNDRCPPPELGRQHRQYTLAFDNPSLVGNGNRELLFVGEPEVDPTLEIRVFLAPANDGFDVDMEITRSDPPDPLLGWTMVFTGTIAP